MDNKKETDITETIEILNTSIVARSANSANIAKDIPRTTFRDLFTYKYVEYSDPSQKQGTTYFDCIALKDGGFDGSIKKGMHYETMCIGYMVLAFDKNGNDYHDTWYYSDKE